MRLRQILSTILLVACGATAAGTPPAPHWPTIALATRMASTAGVPLLAAARAGNRVVAVGDHGAVLLSDDGAIFRQAKSVPVRSTLTSVAFVNGQQGYAAGHDGVLLGTADGGETWTLLRAAPGLEQPILSLHFDSVVHGIAVGLYGWAIETRDGGRTWAELRIGNGDDADRHLLHIFASGAGTLFIAGESGAIFRSSDGGKSWQSLSTGNKGSLWHGRALADGTLLVCGMRGHLYRSSDDGLTWQAVQSHTTQSLTGIAEQADGSVVVVGMAGTVLRSTDSGRTFALSERPAREPLTAVLGGKAGPLLLSMAGVSQ
jgi:photosystem II stability/assembly factor-like uncharacterized protein